MKKFKKNRFILGLICIVSLIFFVYLILKINKGTNLNIDKIEIQKYDVDTYTIISTINTVPKTTNIIQIVDENGNVLNEYGFENTVSYDSIDKNYDSDKLWFTSTNHDKNSSKYRLYVNYNISTKELEYSEYYYSGLDQGNLNIKSSLKLRSNVEDRYELYSSQDGLYMYDMKLNKGVKLNHEGYGRANFVQVSETEGFFDDSGVSDFCFIDFENGTVRYNDSGLNISNNVTYVNSICDVYDDKVLASTLSGDFVLIDKNFNWVNFCDNVNPDYWFTSNMYRISKDKILITQEKESNEPNKISIVMSVIDLNTKKMTKLNTIENNGLGYFGIEYVDDGNVYVYSYYEKVYKFLVLDSKTLKVVKEIPINSDLVESPYFDFPLIIKN